MFLCSGISCCSDFSITATSHAARENISRLVAPRNLCWWSLSFEILLFCRFLSFPNASAATYWCLLRRFNLERSSFSFKAANNLFNYGNYLLKSTMRAVVSPGRTLRFEGRETTASNRLLLRSSRRPAAPWTNKLTLHRQNLLRLSRIGLRLHLLP